MFVVPAPTIVTVLPATVATWAFELVNVTTPPEDDVAERVKAPSPTVFVAKVPKLMVWDALATVSDRLNAELVPPPFVAVSVTVEVPAVVGVPLIKPEVGLFDRPPGSPVAAYEVGLLLAVIW